MIKFQWSGCFNGLGCLGVSVDLRGFGVLIDWLVWVFQWTWCSRVFQWTGWDAKWTGRFFGISVDFVVWCVSDGCEYFCGGLCGLVYFRGLCGFGCFSGLSGMCCFH